MSVHTASPISSGVLRRCGSFQPSMAAPTGQRRPDPAPNCCDRGDEHRGARRQGLLQPPPGTGDPRQHPPLPPGRRDPLTDRHSASVPAAFRKLDAVAVLTARLLPAPRELRPGRTAQPAISRRTRVESLSGGSAPHPARESVPGVGLSDVLTPRRHDVFLRLDSFTAGASRTASLAFCSSESGGAKWASLREESIPLLLVPGQPLLPGLGNLTPGHQVPCTG